VETVKKVYQLMLRWQNIIAGILSLVFLGIFAYVLNIHVPDFIVHHEQLLARFDRLRHLVESFELLAYPLFVCIYFLANSVFIPTFILGVLGGIIFDPFTASLLAIAGLFFSMQTYYWPAKFLGKSFTRRFSSSKILELSSKHKNMDFKSLFYFRINFFVPLHPVNAICGGLDVPFKRFMVSTVVGLAPRAVIYAFLGAGLVRGGSYLLWSVVLWLLLIISQSLFGFWHLKTFTNRENVVPTGGEVR